MDKQVIVEKTKSHLIVKIPLSDIDVKEEMTEDDVLRLADKGLEDYTADKTESFVNFVSRKYPQFNEVYPLSR